MSRSEYRRSARRRGGRRRSAGATNVLASALVVLCVATAGAADPSPVPTGDLAARMSSGAAAMEYWDVTAWLASGHRLLARFLVTNQGPGVQTAAAVGHLILPGGSVVPFKWGRRRDSWTLGAEGRRLTIAKAGLDLGGPAVVLEVDSEKRGIKLRLEIERNAPLVTTRPESAGYSVDVAMPAPAHARVWVRGMDAARVVAGTAVLTHTWMERPEGELLRRRVELLSRDGDVALYLCDLTLANGERRSTVVANRAGRVLARADDVALDFGNTTTFGGDPRYPVASRWDVRSATVAAHVDVSQELLRWDPLEILPLVFRTLVALAGRPQRIWADATVDVTVAPPGEKTSLRAKGGGMIAVTYARPIDLP